MQNVYVQTAGVYYISRVVLSLNLATYRFSLVDVTTRQLQLLTHGRLVDGLFQAKTIGQHTDCKTFLHQLHGQV